MHKNLFYYYFPQYFYTKKERNLQFSITSSIAFKKEKIKVQYYTYYENRYEDIS